MSERYAEKEVPYDGTNFSSGCVHTLESGEQTALWLSRDKRVPGPAQCPAADLPQPLYSATSTVDSDAALVRDETHSTSPHQRAPASTPFRKRKQEG